MPASCPLCKAPAVPYTRRHGLDAHLRGDAKHPGLCPASDGSLHRARILAGHEHECPTGEPRSCPRCTGPG